MATIRHLVAAALMASACAAHADVISSNSGASLTDILLGKAAASAESAMLYYQDGTEGTYMLGSGNMLLAAMVGSAFAPSTGNPDPVYAGTTQVVAAGKDTGNANQTAIGDKGDNSAANATSATNAETRPMPDQLLLAAPAAAVPEPATLALMLAGVFGAGAVKRRRSR